MSTNKIVRVRVSVKTIRELLGIQDNGFRKHVGLKPEDANRRKKFTGHSYFGEDYTGFNQKGTI